MLVVLVAFTLVYVSVLLRIRLGSAGADRRTIVLVIAELWLTFAVIIGVFALLQRLVGPVPRQESIAGELGTQLARVHKLAPGQRALIYGGFALAIGLFISLLWSLRAAQRPVTDGGQNDPTA